MSARLDPDVARYRREKARNARRPASRAHRDAAAVAACHARLNAEESDGHFRAGAYGRQDSAIVGRIVREKRAGAGRCATPDCGKPLGRLNTTGRCRRCVERSKRAERTAREKARRDRVRGHAIVRRLCTTPRCRMTLGVNNQSGRCVDCANQKRRRESAERERARRLAGMDGERRSA